MEESDANIQYEAQIKLENDKISWKENGHFYDGNKKGKADEPEIVIARIGEV